VGKHSKNAPRDQPGQPEPEYRYHPDDYSYEAPPARAETALAAETRPQPALRERKPRSLGKKILTGVVIVLAVLVVLAVIGNLLPQKSGTKGAPGPSPARRVAVADILRNDSPNWHVTNHIVAVVRPEDGGKSVTLVNAGHGTACGVITFPQLGITATAVSVWNVWGHTLSPPTVRALRVVLAPGTAEYLILR